MAPIVAEIYGPDYEQQKAVGRRLDVFQEWWPEQDTVNSEFGFEDTLRGVQLKIELYAGNSRQIWMSKGVVANVVTFIVDPLNEIRPLRGVRAHDEE